MSTNLPHHSESSPIRLLFGDYHLRLLSLLLRRPGEDFYLRQIARLTGIPPGPTQRELQRFAKAGLVLRRRVGNQVRYEANRSIPIYPELRRLLQKTVGLADVLGEALSLLAPRIELAFIFGAAARGEDGLGGDINLLVVTTASGEEVTSVLSPLRERLGRKITPIILKPKAFQRRKQDNTFIERVMSGEKLLLMGSFDKVRES